jgi:protein SCO1
MSPLISRRTLLIALAASACGRKEPLPRLGAVPAFSLTDQKGSAFTRQTLAGQTWVAAFMFTRCPTICPRITARMKDLQQRAKTAGVPIRLVSFTVDPEHDTPPVLSSYARGNSVDESTWTFATGDHRMLAETAVKGFKMALEGRFDASAPDAGILHGSHLVLVDGSSEIRGYYRTDGSEELSRLLQDAERIH